MNTKIIQLLFSLLLTFSLAGQQIVSGEYFFDTAPNHGAGIPINFAANSTVNHSMAIPTTGLNAGIHQLYVRVKNDGNVWSHYQKRMIYVIEPLVVVNTQITEAEWFIDTDPGVGNGVDLPITSGNTISGTVSIPNTLPSGIHHVYIRVKNNLGIWSHQHKSMFYIIEPLTDPSSTIVLAEYFFDTDPGVGNATPLTVTPSNAINESAAINLTGLSTGIHQLFIRVKNNKGLWGHYQKRMVYVTPTTTTENKSIVSAEYFIDTDPGVGQGISIPIVPGTSLLEDFVFNTTGTALGQHHMYIRVKESNGRWSHYAKHSFLICNDVLQAPTISGASTVCQNETLLLTGSTIPNATSYYWTGPNGFNQNGNDLSIPSISDAQSGLYTFYAVRNGSSACDTAYSEVTIQVLPTSFTTNPQQICEGQNYTINGNNYSTSGTYLDTLSGINGCDSIVETQLQVLPSYHIDNIQHICEGQSYTYNGNTYTTSGTYVDAFASQHGCDSIVTTYLTVHPTYTVSNPQTICTGGSYTINGNTYTTAGTYTDILSSINGCDSTVITHLNVVSSFTVDNPQTICEGESYTIGNNTYSQSGTYTDVFTSMQGCDSIVTTQLTVNPVFTVNNPQTICQGESYTINGNTYSISGNYTDVLQSITGCDSIVNTQLTVVEPNFNLIVTLQNNTLISEESNATYQWLNCAGNFSIIPNETAQSFNLTENGVYAVQLTSQTCNFVDTSACITIDHLSLGEQNSITRVQIYPNPTDGLVTIELNSNILSVIKIYDAKGKLVFENQIQNTLELNFANWMNGVYYIEISSDTYTLHQKLLKQ